MSRPTVQVYNQAGKVVAETTLPAVFSAPIRADIVQFTHTQLAKNHRQPYGVSPQAGEQTSAESWGPGRAVARVPRVKAHGTGAAGSAAFANFARGGRMFAPNQTLRRWNRKVNLNVRRYAVVSAVAASRCPALVQARGHQIKQVKEIPCVVDSSVETMTKVADAIRLLKRIGAYADVERVEESKKIRAGRGTMRGRKYKQAVGPMIVYSEDKGCVRAFRNLPGVDVTSVERLNLLRLAPGGHLGRFIIWTQSAFDRLDEIFGTRTEASKQKNGYRLPSRITEKLGFTRVLQAESVASVLRSTKPTKVIYGKRKNPLVNKTLMHRINPYYKTHLKQSRPVATKAE
ncbi:60S ribosomal protein L4-B [Aduncisulcus paluster]|uniref:60S ribosomal protein L4-B n=1 Tax=Aduncisulcus paluster TaxID=2918883 RepID=A0ABQ5JZ90_9EUKA|nr:60S ribosomal protein L4-B [Aduncisulcus paluster]